LGFQEVEAPRISRQSAHESGKVVSPMYFTPLRPKDPRYLFLLENESISDPSSRMD
jgi:hypothetical protein